MDPKVSIIIPVYNGSNFLKEAIDSALDQTYKNIEIIVVNDGSEDNGATEEIARSYGNKIKYYSKKNGGVATALNFGIKKMTGKYFSWLSHDDMYEKTKIEEQIKLIKNINSQNVIIACNTKTLFLNGLLKKEFIDNNTFKYFDIFLATSANVGLNGCALLIPKKAVDEYEGFNINLPFTQDYDLWFRLNEKYNFILLEKNLVISRRHNEQGSVKEQKIFIKADDKLHKEFLLSIKYERFKQYLESYKGNAKYIWENYTIYKNRGYTKTASIILNYILNYYYETNKERFYKVFNSETMFISNKLNRLKKQENKNIENTYKKLQENNKLEQYLEQKLLKFYESHTPDLKSNKKSRRFVTSIKRDGAYLTSRKVLLKIHTKTKNKK